MVGISDNRSEASSVPKPFILEDKVKTYANTAVITTPITVPKKEKNTLIE